MACDFSEEILCSEAGSSQVHCKRNRVFSKPHTAWKMGLSLFRCPQRMASGTLFSGWTLKFRWFWWKRWQLWLLLDELLTQHCFVKVILYYLVWRKLRAHRYKYRYEHLKELSKCFMSAKAHGLLMLCLSWPSIFHSCGKQWFTQNIWCCLCTLTRWPK